MGYQRRVHGELHTNDLPVKSNRKIFSKIIFVNFRIFKDLQLT